MKIGLRDFEGVLEMETDEAESRRKRRKYPGKVIDVAASPKARQFFITIRLPKRVGFTALDALSLNKRFAAYFLQYMQGNDALFLSEHAGPGIEKGADVVLAQMEDASLKAQEKAMAAFKEYANPYLAEIFEVLFNGGAPTKIKQCDVKCTLNPAQKKCAALVLGMKEGQFFLVHGPPGTGKTTTILSILENAIEMGWKVLVASHTNIAVDNIFEKLSAGAKKKAVRIGNTIKTIESVHELLQNEEEGLPIKKTLAVDLKDAGIVGVTLSKLGFLREWKLVDWENPAFDLVIIDEASMCSLPMSLLALLNGKRFLLAGDHLQLSPILLSKQSDGFLEINPDARKSLFEVLMGAAPENSGFLDVQYRGHDKIMGFVSGEFYGGALKTAPNLGLAPEKKEDNTCMSPISNTENVLVWVDSSPGSSGLWRRYGRAFSYVNEYEARLCTRIYYHFTNTLGYPKEDIAVITPFRLQSDLIKEQLWRASSMKLDLSTIQTSDSRTVHAFQGREKKIVIYNFVLDNVFYHTTERFRIFADNRMLNVALSRAKHKLVIVGSSKIADATELPVVSRLYEHVKKNGVVFDSESMEKEYAHLDEKISGCLPAITQR